MVSEVKESSDDFWTIFDLFYEHYWTIWTIEDKFYAFVANSTYFKNITVVQNLFFLRGEIRYTPSERREKGERFGYRQDPIISMVHRDTTLW